MDRMFRVLGFLTFVIALLFIAGHYYWQAGLFFLQTLFFVIAGYLKLTEKTYMYLFAAYMFVSFCGMVFYSTFMMQ
jgi:hypothetical protein